VGAATTGLRMVMRRISSTDGCNNNGERVSQGE
jgi:hypothetical protein